MKTQQVREVAAEAPRLPSSGEVCSLTLDAAGVIVDASPGCAKLFERGMGEIVGVAAHTLLVGLERIGATAEGSSELHARRAANPSHVRAFWTRDGARLHLLVVNLERLQSPFTQSAQQARFGSLVTHEARNPLSSIKIVVQTLARGAVADERVMRRLSLAAREVRTLERVLGALSDLTRRPPAAPEALDSAALLEAVLAACASELAERESAVELRCGAGLPCVAGQPDRLKGALVQLVCEAARMRPGTALTLTASAVGGALVLELRPGAKISPREFGLCLMAVDAVVGEIGGRLEIDPEGEAWRISLPGVDAAR